MSLSLTPYATASAMARAIAANSAGVTIKAKYIGVGSGHQEIIFDDAGRAITDTMKTPVAWLEILRSETITPYQHQMTVDFAGVKSTEWLLSEVVLADEDKNVIAIYGHKTQSLMAVSPAVDVALLPINFVLATLPAGSVEIIHQGAAVDLFMAREKLALDQAVGSWSLTTIKQVLERKQQALIDAQKYAEHISEIEAIQASWVSTMREEMREEIGALIANINGQKTLQDMLNHQLEISVGGLSYAIIKGLN